MIEIRNPNSYGSVYKLKGNRRRPYAVSITVGVELIGNKARYKRKILGYFATQKQAREFLAEYNSKDIGFDALNITLAEIWNKIKTSKFKEIKEARQNGYNSAFVYLAPIQDEIFKKLKTADLQRVVDACPKSSGVKLTMKTILKLCYEFALENDIVDRDYSKYIKIETKDKKIERVILSERVSRCEFATKEPFCDITLILLYSGMRINELLKNNAMNFNKKDMTLTIPVELAKNKTSARTIPIHEQIQEPLERFFALPAADRPNYRQAYDWMKSKGFTPHSTRYTFATRAHECKMDELTIRKIMGHAPENILQKVYTQISMEEMKKEMLKFNYVC